MIDKALKVIVDGLNQHLEARFPPPGPFVVLSHGTDPDNTTPQSATGCILVTLVNLERESFAPKKNQGFRPRDGELSRRPPPLQLNLAVLISANFPHCYEHGLSVLSSAMSYFQAHPVFDPANTPSFPPELAHLSVEWRDMDLDAMNSLWTALGRPYQPSVVYLVRMPAIESDVRGEGPDTVTGAGVEK